MDNAVGAVFLLVHHCGSDWHLLFFNSPATEGSSERKCQADRCFNFPCLQGSCESSVMLFSVLERSSSGIGCAKMHRVSGQSQWRLLPLIPRQAGLSLQYNQLLGSLCHSRTKNEFSPSVAQWHYGTLCTNVY